MFYIAPFLELYSLVAGCYFVMVRNQFHGPPLVLYLASLHPQLDPGSQHHRLGR